MRTELEVMKEAAQMGGERILELFNQSLDIEQKSTVADFRAQADTNSENEIEIVPRDGKWIAVIAWKQHSNCTRFGKSVCNCNVSNFYVLKKLLFTGVILRRLLNDLRSLCIQYTF